MRILSVGNMYPPHHLGGYELMWRSSVRQLREAGHEVRVLTTDYRRDPPEWEGEDADVHRDLRWYWADHQFPYLSWRRRLALERGNLATIDRHLDESGAEVVCWWAMGGMSLSMLEHVRQLGTPALGVVVDDWLIYGLKVDAWQRAFAKPLIGPLLSRATGIPTGFRLEPQARWLLVSNALLDHAREAGLDLGRPVIAPGGIDPEMFDPAPVKQWSGRLLCLGRIDERKGIANAIRCLEYLPECTLRVVGGGDDAYLRTLKAMTADLGLGERVSFETLSRERVNDAYAEADVTLFPVTWEEPWGLVPLESMAVGTPVVATGSGGSAEYLRDGENCLIFRPADDPRALADAILRLADDESLRARLRDHGFKAAARYTEPAFNRAVQTAVEGLAP
jgi:glycogen(starch) synthase